MSQDTVSTSQDTVSIRLRIQSVYVSGYCQYVSGYCQYAQSILPQTGNKMNEFRCFEVKIQESEKSRQSPGIEPRTPLT